MKKMSKYFVVVWMLLLCTMVSWGEEDTAKFVSGTAVNNISIGGLGVEEAKERIEGFYAGDYNLTIRKKGGSADTIKGSDISYKTTVLEGLQEILEEQNKTGRKSGPDIDNSHRIQMSVSYDEAALTAKISALSSISSADIIITSDAHISAYQEGQPFTIIPEVNGTNVDVGKVEALIRDAIATGKNNVSLEEADCYNSVQVKADDERLLELCDTMNRCKDMAITYTMGASTEVLSGSVICTWLTGSIEGQIGVRREAAAAYVKTLADKYNTVGTARSFHTTTGKDVSLTGPYGWKIDQEAETNALIGMIQTAQTQSREPQYAQGAANRNGSDWGATYVEIDLGGQHVYLYRDGILAWDAPCVTGNISKSYTTPAGIYSLYYKQTDKVLRGKKQADGTYEYESPVKYWMPFNGGIGLHDADWRGKFGGTIYQYSGSHGCINLPPAKVKALYDQVYAGIPIICHN